MHDEEINQKIVAVNKKI